MLTDALFYTFIILEANFKVEIVSSMCLASGQTFATITVLQLPPSESFKMFVNLLCLYGIWLLYFSLKATPTCSK